MPQDFEEDHFKRSALCIQEILQEVEDELIKNGLDEYVVSTERGSFIWRQPNNFAARMSAEIVGRGASRPDSIEVAARTQIAGSSRHLRCKETIRHHSPGPRRPQNQLSPSLDPISESIRVEVRAGLERCLARLWRYALLLSKQSDVAEDLVQATCVRAIERADQFTPGTQLDRWLFAILRSIWLNEVRARRIRQGEGFIDSETALVIDGAKELESNILAAEVLKVISLLPEAQRQTVLLVYGEGYSYTEAANLLGIPVGTVMSRLATARSALARLR